MGHQSPETATFEELLRRTAPAVDLQNGVHAQALLEWLNKWGCRIATTEFPALSARLKIWIEQWGGRLPLANAEIVDLQAPGLDAIADAYDALLKARLRGPTCAAKILFALRSKAAIPWDEPIRAEFNLSRSRQGFRDMLQRSKDEAEKLISDAAARCGGGNPRDIPSVIGRPTRSIVRLLDEYHWITITRGHQIPICDELRQWVAWACP